jgi:uncharacterized protein
MKLFRVVADSSALIGLAQIGQFELLNQLFAEIYIPESVYNEVVIEGKGEPGAEETGRAVRIGLMIRKAAADQFAVQALTSTLGEGESEVIILYKELALDYALIDDRIARNMAEIMDVRIIGILGILDLAIARGIKINKEALVDHSISSGFRISGKLYSRMFPGP